MLVLLMGTLTAQLLTPTTTDVLVIATSIIVGNTIKKYNRPVSAHLVADTNGEVVYEGRSHVQFLATSELIGWEYSV